MKHMPGYDFFAPSCWVEGGGEQPGEHVREKVTVIPRISYPGSTAKRHRPTDLGTSETRGRSERQLKIRY